MTDGKGTSFDVLPHFVNYTLADDGGNACGGNRSRPTTLQPDIIDTDTSPIAMAARSTQPVWVTVDVPRDAPAGDYQSTLTVTATGQDPIELTLHLKVIDRVLPEPSAWKFHLDLWQNPWAIARYHGLAVWSQAHKDAISAQLKMLANAGQKAITATIVHQPWNGSTYDPYESMVEWTKNADGTWTYDFTRFDDYVQLAEAAGINGQISCYSMVALGDKYRYHDVASDSDVTLTLTAGTLADTDHWTPFLQAFRSHLIAKGWLDRTMISMDERGEAVMLAAVNLIKTVAPELKVSLAGHYHASLEPDLYAWSINGLLINTQTLSIIKNRKAAGKISTFYGACDIPAPNMFTYSPLADCVWYGWYAAAAGFDVVQRHLLLLADVTQPLAKQASMPHVVRWVVHHMSSSRVPGHGPRKPVGTCLPPLLDERPSAPVSVLAGLFVAIPAVIANNALATPAPSGKAGVIARPRRAPVARPGHTSGRGRRRHRTTARATFSGERISAAGVL
jgi:hypothetical protein